MRDATGGSAIVPEWWTDEQYCYLTTTGRVTGRPHEIEIWFSVHEGRVYVISGRGEEADWVKNLRVDPGVTVRVGEDERRASARVVEDGGEHPARRVIAGRYQGWREGRSLSGWAANATLVEIAIAPTSKPSRSAR